MHKRRELSPTNFELDPDINEQLKAAVQGIRTQKENGEDIRGGYATLDLSRTKEVSSAGTSVALVKRDTEVIKSQDPKVDHSKTVVGDQAVTQENDKKKTKPALTKEELELERKKRDKQRKKKHIANSIYRVFVSVMILCCFALVGVCIQLLYNCNEPNVKYLYIFEGTSGYDAPEGVTIDENGTQQIENESSSVETTSEVDPTQTLESKEEETSFVARPVLDAEDNTGNVLFDPADE